MPPANSDTSVMMMMEEEEEEEYGGDYYVQSPSSVSHANYYTTTTEPSQLFLMQRSPYNNNNDHSHLQKQPTNPLLLNQFHKDDHHHNNILLSSSSKNKNNNNNISRCWSSGASSFAIAQLNNKMLPDDANVILVSSADNISNDMTTDRFKKLGKVAVVRRYHDDDQQRNFCQYFSFTTYESPLWIALQLLWRFLLSAMLALLVFYLATRPPPPLVELKVIGVKQFELTEGVDLSGVGTNLLSCNFSMKLIIENRSKLFGVHIMSPVVDVYFGRLPLFLMKSQVSRNNMYVGSRAWREMEVTTGTRKKEMYGGGRAIEDMLSSEKGLPLFINLAFNSYFTPLPLLIHSHFHHQAHCLLLLRHSLTPSSPSPSPYSYNTTCHLNTS